LDEHVELVGIADLRVPETPVWSQLRCLKRLFRISSDRR
jgi:hypothetical protein